MHVAPYVWGVKSTDYKVFFSCFFFGNSYTYWKMKQIEGGGQNKDRNHD